MKHWLLIINRKVARPLGTPTKNSQFKIKNISVISDLFILFEYSTKFLFFKFNFFDDSLPNLITLKFLLIKKIY